MASQHSNAVNLTLSLPSSKSAFSQPFKDKCISEVVGIMKSRQRDWKVVFADYKSPKGDGCFIYFQFL